MSRNITQTGAATRCLSHCLASGSAPTRLLDDAQPHMRSCSKQLVWFVACNFRDIQCPPPAAGTCRSVSPARGCCRLANLQAAPLSDAAAHVALGAGSKLHLLDERLLVIPDVALHNTMRWRHIQPAFAGDMISYRVAGLATPPREGSRRWAETKYAPTTKVVKRAPCRVGDSHLPDGNLLLVTDPDLLSDLIDQPEVVRHQLHAQCEPMSNMQAVSDDVNGDQRNRDAVSKCLGDRTANTNLETAKDGRCHRRAAP